jgi:hypothetical protein
MRSLKYLKPDPFCKFSLKYLKPDPFCKSSGSDFASRFQVKLLANMIPARSVAMGREEIPSLGRFNERNFDLSSDAFQASWPQERLANDQKLRRWLHSDARVVAYFYNYRLFEKWVELGNLK